jgi:hypothetical protein
LERKVNIFGAIPDLRENAVELRHNLDTNIRKKLHRKIERFHHQTGEHVFDNEELGEFSVNLDVKVVEKVRLHFDEALFLVDLDDHLVEILIEFVENKNMGPFFLFLLGKFKGQIIIGFYVLFFLLIHVFLVIFVLIDDDVHDFVFLRDLLELEKLKIGNDGASFVFVVPKNDENYAEIGNKQPFLQEEELQLKIVVEILVHEVVRKNVVVFDQENLLQKIADVLKPVVLLAIEHFFFFKKVKNKVELLREFHLLACFLVRDERNQFLKLKAVVLVESLFFVLELES